MNVRIALDDPQNIALEMHFETYESNLFVHIFGVETGEE